jgi:hypothetical protein
LALVVLVALHKQHRATATTVLLGAIAVLALGALPVVGQQGLAVQQQHKVLDQQDLPLQMPLLFFLIKQVQQVTQIFILQTEALEALVFLVVSEVEEVKAPEVVVVVGA